ncbi:hypothetical protein [Nonomuraea guangzhouensis]|uniref:Tetratricopeptide repeat protein n=1 Tax=Nonomuraea guangzhouensis TaxID=1291555 RepID=A0ABW4GRG5_9ACTN|nr:hypothetical protein [Nonomuraea guangzhouensis]
MLADLVAELRSAERTFLYTGNVELLDRAETLIGGDLADVPFAAPTRPWLSLLRYDRTGKEAHLDAAIGVLEASSWSDPRLIPLAAAVLLRRCARDGDVTDLDHAIEAGSEHACGAQAGPLWLDPAWRLMDLSRARLERYRLGADEADLRHAVDTARRAAKNAGERIVRAMCLGHLALCEQELYLASGTRSLLDRAIRRYERALAMAGTSPVVRPMLLTEYGTALQDRFAEDQDLADADCAITLAREAAQAQACRPDLACHWVNHGTALMTRYESTGDPADLDEALRRWNEAMDMLPAGSPYRPAFHDRLAYGFLTRWEHGHGTEADVELAVSHGRPAVREGASRPEALVYRNHLTQALSHRWRIGRAPADLDEAVTVVAGAVEAPGNAQALLPDLLANLAHTLLNRYEALGDPEDIEAALQVMHRLNGRDLRQAQRATCTAAVARALTLRYEAAGSPADLAAGIAAARRSLAGGPDITGDARLSWLVRLVHLRYLRYGRRRDLDLAIRSMATAIGDEAGADNLGNLAALLSERYERDGDPADQAEALSLGRRALQGNVSESAHLGNNLAAALHDRFHSEGRWDELEEAVAHHREALALEAATSPRLPTMLNNFGGVLQDVYLYSEDAGLDEAIDAHRRAVELCPAASPHRPGCLATLGAALQLRFERDRRPADLNRAVDLYEQALEALDAGAPDRTMVLANLASVLHLRAMASGRRADHDRVVDVFRSALRRVRGPRPVRAILLSNYAQALAERHDRFGHPYRRAEVLGAYRKAAAASQGQGVMRLHTMTAFGTWTARRGLWPLAVEACHAAVEARRALFGVQRERAHQTSWLRWGEDVNAAEAVARIRCGMPGKAVAALDGGRALGLSEALETRTLPDRLRAQGHDELAARYERAVARLARALTARAVEATRPGLPGRA